MWLAKGGSLFQVWDFQPGFFHSSSRSHLSWSCVLPQRDVELQPVNKSTPVPVQGNLFTHLCFPSGKVRSQPQLMPGMSQSYHTWEGVINHPSSSTSPCFSFWPCMFCLDVHVPHQDSHRAHSPLPSSSHLLTIQQFPVNPSHLCS